MRLIFLIPLLSCLLPLALSGKVFDLAGVFKNYTCLKAAGFDYAIIRAYHSFGAIDIDASDNIKLANQAGLPTDVYMFPCRGKSPTVQVNELLTYLDHLPTTQSFYDGLVGTIWLDIETNPSAGCSWKQGTPESNCDFVMQLIKAIASKGRKVGIYASGYMWTEIFGSKDFCSSFTQFPIWYAHYDGKQSFDDWGANKFGGWTKPTLKQYAGDSVVCGYKMDLSFF